MLGELLPVDVKPKRIPTPKSKKPITPDLTIPSLKIVVEYDGHYWHSDLEKLIRDREINDCLKDVGWKTLRIRDGLKTIGALYVRVSQGADVFICALAVLNQLVEAMANAEIDVAEDAQKSIEKCVETYQQGGERVAEAEAEGFLQKRFSEDAGSGP